MGLILTLMTSNYLGRILKFRLIFVSNLLKQTDVDGRPPRYGYGMADSCGAELPLC